MNLETIKKDFPYHQDKDDDFYVMELAKSYRHCNVRKFNFSNTTISYDPIVALWKSDNIGYYMGDVEGVYERYYNKLISIILIEIKDSKAHEQYLSFKRKNTNNDSIVKLFPLPYRNNFMIDSGSDGIVNGLKEIVLTIDGKRIDDD